MRRRWRVFLPQSWQGRMGPAPESGCETPHSGQMDALARMTEPHSWQCFCRRPVVLGDGLSPLPASSPGGAPWTLEPPSWRGGDAGVTTGLRTGGGASSHEPRTVGSPYPGLGGVGRGTRTRWLQCGQDTVSAVRACCRVVPHVGQRRSKRSRAKGGKRTDMDRAVKGLPAYFGRCDRRRLAELSCARRGADRSALRKGGTGRFAPSYSVSGPVLVRAPGLH